MSAIEAEEFVRRLDAAVSAADVESITRQVQREIENALVPGRLRLDERFRRTRTDHYARRLLHRDPARRYTVLVLAWAPGQGTPIHDHPNLWSVEGVLEGELEVTQFAPIKEEAHRCRFAPVESHRVVAGDANFLIPPFEYHALTNDLTDRPCLTLHVFGGELMEMNTFDSVGNGWYERSLRRVAYDD
jgi:predicted metal-dependent enzyme (double-stranded beta helix superfamily)